MNLKDFEKPIPFYLNGQQEFNVIPQNIGGVFAIFDEGYDLIKCGYRANLKQDLEGFVDENQDVEAVQHATRKKIREYISKNKSTQFKVYVNYNHENERQTLRAQLQCVFLEKI